MKRFSTILFIFFSFLAYSNNNYETNMHGCNLIINKDSTIKKTFSIQLSGMSVHFEPFNPSYYNKIYSLQEFKLGIGKHDVVLGTNIWHNTNTSRHKCFTGITLGYQYNFSIKSKTNFFFRTAFYFTTWELETHSIASPDFYERKISLYNSYGLGFKYRPFKSVYLYGDVGIAIRIPFVSMANIGIGYDIFKW